MALKYKDLKDPEVNNPLTEEELRFIDKVEKYIDGEIRKQWTSSYGVSIDLNIASFGWDPILKTQIRFNDFRRDKMRKELESRYKKADWSIEVKFDDGLDGPNMSGPDQWILHPKKR
jgi:hypothetical protein